MTINSNNGRLPGHENSSSGTWNISYRMSSGVHPETKKAYSGEGRNAYLPKSPEGDEILALLIIAFERKLILTVGFSPTRGTDGVVCWNGIHHKTSTHGGPASYGYPDETYLQRVKEELKLKNCFFSSEEEKQAGI